MVVTSEVLAKGRISIPWSPDAFTWYWYWMYAVKVRWGRNNYNVVQWIPSWLLNRCRK